VVQSFDGKSGQFLSSFGAAGDGPGLFNKAKGIAVDSLGHLYVADAMQDAVFIFDDAGRFLLAFGGSGEGPGGLSLPAGVGIDEHDRIYVADSMHGRVQVFDSVAEAAP